MVKRLFNRKKLPKKRQGVFKKTEIVLISVHLETGLKLTVVQRFKDAFIGEIWLPVRETGRFVLCPGDSRIIRENWHVWFSVGFSGENSEQTVKQPEEDFCRKHRAHCLNAVPGYW